MNQPKDNRFSDRLETAAKAREAMLARYRARPSADDPDVIARQAERQAVIRARGERNKEREAERLVAEARRVAEVKAQREFEAAEVLRLAAEKVARQAALAAEQKEARDARFAARKARARK